MLAATCSARQATALPREGADSNRYQSGGAHSSSPGGKARETVSSPNGTFRRPVGSAAECTRTPRCRLRLPETSEFKLDPVSGVANYVRRGRKLENDVLDLAFSLSAESLSRGPSTPRESAGWWRLAYSSDVATMAFMAVASVHQQVRPVQGGRFIKRTVLGSPYGPNVGIEGEVSPTAAAAGAAAGPMPARLVFGDTCARCYSVHPLPLLCSPPAPPPAARAPPPAPPAVTRARPCPGRHPAPRQARVRRGFRARAARAAPAACAAAARRAGERALREPRGARRARRLARERGVLGVRPR
jgi:hypothetical protein